MSNKENKTQVAIIGAGPGGYPAAFLAADLGLEVTLIDPEDNPGGVCLYRGCIPSKALLHSAKVISEAEHLKNLGITFNKPKIDLDKLRDWKNSVVEKLVGGLGQLSKQRKITYIQGRATFLDSNTLEITRVNETIEKLEFEYAVIATGSRPAQIPSFPNDSPNLLNSTSALDLPEIPKTMLVVGGGYIGPIYESIMLNTKVVEMKESSKGIKVTLEAEKLEETELTFDKVLVSVGRTPNSENLGLENTGVEIDIKGFIKIDAQRRTSNRNIFAIGDVAGEPMLAHKATHEGRIVAEIIAGRDVAFEPSAIPAAMLPY